MYVGSIQTVVGGSSTAFNDMVTVAVGECEFIGCKVEIASIRSHFKQFIDPAMVSI
jgi:hypothetical protein